MLIDISDLSELDDLRAGADGLRIGALTRHAAFHRIVVDGPLVTLSAKVAGHIAHYSIRQRGTFAGSLAQADPASEWCLVATALDAIVVAKSARVLAAGAGMRADQRMDDVGIEALGFL